MTGHAVLWWIGGGLVGLLILGFLVVRRIAVRPSAEPFERDRDGDASAAGEEREQIL